MDLMDQISKPVNRASIITIVGDAGVGKTSLAAIMPDPIFIRAEDGLQSVPAEFRPDAFPLIEGEADLWQQLTTLIHRPHNYRTVVIDSVTALERLFIAEVLAADPKARSINQAMGGYGAGAAAVAAKHQRVRKAAGLLNEKRGLNIVFVAHADVEQMKLPDQDDYQRWSLRMPSKSAPPYIDDVDLVALVRLVTFTVGEEGERKKARSTGAREIVCHATAASVAKNRFGITEPLSFDLPKNPFAGIVPGLGKKNYAAAKIAALRAAAEAAEAEKAKEEVVEDSKPISNDVDDDANTPTPSDENGNPVFQSRRGEETTETKGTE